jgi:hypothetical protein
VQPPLDELLVPDVAGEVVGYKALFSGWVDPRDPQQARQRVSPQMLDELLREKWFEAIAPVLASPRNGQLWPTDEWTVATCDNGRAVYFLMPPRSFGRQPEALSVAEPLVVEKVTHADAGLPVPQEQCSCGIYAVDSMQRARGYARGHDYVLVRVAGAGRVIPGTNGWRAERARITGIVDWRSSLPYHRTYEAEVPLDLLARVYDVELLELDHVVSYGSSYHVGLGITMLAPRTAEAARHLDLAVAQMQAAFAARFRNPSLRERFFYGGRPRRRGPRRRLRGRLRRLRQLDQHRLAYRRPNGDQRTWLRPGGSAKQPMPTASPRLHLNRWTQPFP